MRHSIRARLILVFISLAIGPLLVVGVILARQSFTVLEQQALILQQEAAKRVASQVTAFFQELESELRFTVQTQRLGELDQDSQRSVLSNLLAYQSAFDELHLLNSQGQEEVGVYRIGLASTAPVDRSQADEFAIPQTTGQIYYGPVRYDQITNEPLMTIAIPVINLRTGSADGVLVSVARIKKVWDLIAGIQVSQGQSIYIVDDEGKVVAHRNPSVVLRGSTFTVPQQDGIQPGLGGERVVLASKTMSLGQQQLSIVAEQTVSEALALAFNTILISAGVVVVVLVLASALGLAIVRQIVQPIQTMAVAAQAISTGDLSQQIRIARQDELGVLAHAFNSMTTQLQSVVGGLEKQVAERTQELEQRSSYLQATAEIGSAAASLLDRQQLIQEVVELIRERFGLHYVGLFQVEEAGTGSDGGVSTGSAESWVVLRAGTGEAGRAMLARGHRIRVGEGMVGWAVARGQSRVAGVAGEDAVRLATPELPETRSEAALPLRSRGRVLGALTVQHTQPGAFDEDTMAVLQTMADQVAVALDNASLFAESQEALEAARRAYGELGRGAWRDLLHGRRDWGYRYADRTVVPATGDLWPEMLRAEQTGQIILQAPSRPEQRPEADEASVIEGGPPETDEAPASEGGPPETDEASASEGGHGARGPTLSIPLVVGGEVVGVLGFRKAEAGQTWTPEETEMLEAFVAQLELALDSARLYQDTQRRAAEDRLIGEVTARIRETLDVDAMLRTAIQEMGAALDIPRVEVRMRGRREV